MPVPSDITALSTTAASNSPAGSETPASLDDYLRSQASFIAQIREVIGGSSNPDIPNALAANLANSADPAKGAALVGYKGRTVKSKLDDVVSVMDFGAVGDGVADDTAAFASAATASNNVTVPSGAYRFSSTINISATLVFDAGAVLKPASGVKVNLQKSPVAGLYQIFDRSAGGAVQFVGGGVPRVYAEWWGANSSRTDNNIPIQHALDAVQSVIADDFTTPAPNDDNSGGEVVLGYSQEYLVSGRLHVRNRARISGQGRYSELKANAATWSGGEMIYSVNGLTSQFWCSLTDLTLNANDVAAITKVIYAPAWQESCGLRDVLVQNFKGDGVYIEEGYGGAVGVSFRSVQFFPSTTAFSGKSCIFLNIPSIIGVYNLLLDEVSFAGAYEVSPPNTYSVGVKAKGRIRIQCAGVHGESIDSIFLLDTDASLYGLVSATGNPSVTSVIEVQSTWTGKIDLQRVNKGSAVNLIKSFAAGTTGIFLAREPIFGRLVYPHTPTEVLAYARNTSSAGSLDSSAFGFASIVRTGAGAYELNIDATKFAPSDPLGYRVRVDITDFSGTGRQYYVASQTTTKLTLQFRTNAGAAADCDFFDVCVFGRPGL